MRINTGVSMRGVRSEILFAAIVADNTYRDMFGYGVTITSVTDGEHGRGSLHYVGLAIDIRTRGEHDAVQWGLDVKTVIACSLRESLGSEYDVVIENNHIHIEFQPKTEM